MQRRFNTKVCPFFSDHSCVPQFVDDGVRSVSVPVEYLLEILAPELGVAPKELRQSSVLKKVVANVSLVPLCLREIVESFPAALSIAKGVHVIEHIHELHRVLNVFL